LPTVLETAQAVSDKQMLTAVQRRENAVISIIIYDPNKLKNIWVRAALGIFFWSSGLRDCGIGEEGNEVVEISFH
jgi:hypothetical protein